MAIAVDGSSPAVAASSTATTVTAAFTPPDASGIVVFAQGDKNDSSHDEALTIVDSFGLTWYSFRCTINQPSTVEVWWAYCDTSPGSITLTGTSNKGASAKRLYTRVFTGTDPQVIGAIQDAGTGSAGYTSLGDNSWGWATILGTNIAPVAGSGQTLQDSTTGFDSGDAVATWRQNSTTPTAGTTVTMNVTGTTGIKMVAVEIVEPLPPLPPGSTSPASKEHMWHVHR